MSDILCRWLNEELRLSKAVDPRTFAKDFSTGYLIGEVLHKYQLQNDFSLFMKKETSVSRLNNFTRIEPTLQLLGISFDINTAQDLMQEKQGVATCLLYQLYVLLGKKKKAEISSTLMEIMPPADNAGLHKKEHEIHSDRLHQMVKHDAELKLQKISQHYEEICQQRDDRFVMTHLIQQKKQLRVQDEKRMKNIEKLRVSRQKHNAILTCNQTIAQVPKPPPYTSQLNLRKRQQQQQRREHAQTVQTEIAQFEKRKKTVTSDFASSLSGQPFPGVFLSGSTNQSYAVRGSGTKMTLQSNSKYIQDIRQRLEENAVARERREKRRDRFLVEQLKAHEAQEEAQREEQLVKRMTRQTRQEQRLVAQLLQIRMQKDVIWQNRLFREQQYQQRRERDFQEALEREAALAQQTKLDLAEDIRKELEFCNRIAADRAQSRYKKHFNICKDILEQIVDLATKVGEYRLVTGNLFPEKAMREWKELLFRGLPLYEPIKCQQPVFEFPFDPVMIKKQEILKNQDYDEYTNMVGEWAWPEEAGETISPLTNNNILGHVVKRLRSIVHRAIREPSSPSFPHFTLKACVLGKFCSGKTVCLAKFAEAHGICVLSPDKLIEEALNAHQNGEEMTEQQGEKDSEQQLITSSMSLKPDVDNQEISKDSNVRLSTRAMQGAAVEKELKKGNSIPNELLVDIIVEAIRHIPAHSGWILDGFPVDITQAHLLEKALGGSIDERSDVVCSRTNLAADPNPPKPPPPPPPALDLALLLDVPDECVVKRPFCHMETDKAAATTSHHPIDKNLYLAQIPHRITAFQDTWPKLEKWFGERQNILVNVDADVDEEELYKRVESVLQPVMMQTQEVLATPADEGQVLEVGKDPDSSFSAPPVDRHQSITDEAPGPTESYSSLSEENAQSVKSLSKSNTQSPRGPSRNMSPSSVTNEDSQGVSYNPPESASPCPGSSSWIYVDDPLPPEIPGYLCSSWDTVCDSYVNNIKTVMQQLRSLCTVINYHLFNIREEYKHFLGRPDLKQELVSHWQRDFNSIPDDMREDKDTKAELYLRLDELRERLWDISDKRKEEDETERTALMGDDWLEEYTVVLVNHHFTLMQVELDRFQDTLCILKVYYLSMDRQVLPELPSKLVCIPLLDTSEIKDPGKSTEPDTSVCSQMDDGEDKREAKLRPDSMTKSQGQTEPVKPPHERLIFVYKEALSAISKMVSAETHQGDITEQKEKPQEKDSASAKKKEKRRQSSKKQKGLPSPHPAPSPAPADDKNSEKTHKVKNKIHQEYAAALEHEENAAKVRIALVKGHGLVMLQSLQSRAEQTLSDLKKWLEAHYLAEMKSIDQLSEVVCHHIETGAKLQNALVLECTDFYLNGDCHMVASAAPPPRPPPLEKPTSTTPTISQLESFYQQLCNVAPSGLMSSSEFYSLFRDMISINISRNTWPEPWINKNETQLMEIVSLLTDDYELIDWRRFLLSAALPWPFPSLSQLLVLLQRFKAADTANTGYINEEQYLQSSQDIYPLTPSCLPLCSCGITIETLFLQTELWFSSQSVQSVPEDPSEPLPYDRLNNLRKFFFQLFVDRSLSPLRLNYVSMLQYFAADPDPRQGFIRALSVVLGQRLRCSSVGHLVKSMPSIEEATELSSSQLDEDYNEDETLCVSSSSLGEQEVSIAALLAVICHRVPPLTPGHPSQEELTEQLVLIFRELGYKREDSAPFSVLSQHPCIQGLMEASTHYQLVNIHNVLLDEGKANSLTVS